MRASVWATCDTYTKADSLSRVGDVDSQAGEAVMDAQPTHHEVSPLLPSSAASLTAATRKSWKKTVSVPAKAKEHPRPPSPLPSPEHRSPIPKLFKNLENDEFIKLATYLLKFYLYSVQCFLMIRCWTQIIRLRFLNFYIYLLFQWKSKSISVFEFVYHYKTFKILF